MAIRACNWFTKLNFLHELRRASLGPSLLHTVDEPWKFWSLTFLPISASTSISRNVTRVRTHSMKNNFANHTKTYTLHLWWLLIQYITLTRLFILIVSKFIGEKIAFEERLKSYGLRFTFVSFQVLIPPSPIGGKKERGGGGKGKKKRNIRKEVTREWRAKNCQTAWSDFKESPKQYLSSSSNLHYFSEKS